MILLKLFAHKAGMVGVPEGGRGVAGMESVGALIRGRERGSNRHGIGRGHRRHKKQVELCYATARLYSNTPLYTGLFLLFCAE